jgi:L-amino acid N-acyltransferase YncA
MIRKIEEKDIEACKDLYNWYIEHTAITFETEVLSLQEFRERVHKISHRYPYLVKEEAGKILGYAYLDSFNSRAAYDWTADVSIYLRKESRGKGAGTELFEALIDQAEADGYVNLVSLITEGNEASEKIHAKLGFEKLAFFPDFGFKKGHWYGVSYYVKTLRKPEDAGEPEKPVNL